jgi:DnaJ family protein C protein 8
VRAQEAFGLLAKAHDFLLDMDKRKFLLEIVEDAKDACRKKKRIKSTDPLATTPQFLEEVKVETKRLLLEEELRRRKSVKRIMENEGKEAEEHQKKVQEGRESKEREKAWEETRDGRVASWRDFQTKASSKKKATGEFKPPKATTSDDAKTYVRRVVPSPQKSD